MRRPVGTIVGKTVSGAIRLRHKGSGQALPGMIIQRLMPSYMAAMLSSLPEGVVIITGTNGKTTTTKMVAELLKANGKRVLTNPTGSNMTRGIASTIVRHATLGGKLPYDIAVLELDEAYAAQFAKEFTPRWVLGLNVSRDQLDRFGEVDSIAAYITTAMSYASEGIVVNADDKRLSEYADGLDTKSHQTVAYFGVAPSLLRFFPRDDELVSIGQPNAILKQATTQPLSVELTEFEGTKATYRSGKETFTTSLQLTGQHNFQNATAALALLKVLLPNVHLKQLVDQLSNVETAFGRGQIFTLKNGTTVQLAVVKNPSSFRQGLASYMRPQSKLMIVINDNIADSRDMSWLWDIDFRSLQIVQPIAMVSGTRAVDMALRLHYDDVAVDTIEPSIGTALEQLCILPGNKLIFASYTAMLELYDLLTKRAGSSL